MKTPLCANSARLNCKIRPDIKAALEDLAVKFRKVEGGGYVGLTRVMNEASLMLLRREGIKLKKEPVMEPVMELPKPKPVKSLRLRRRARVAEQAS